MLQFVGSTSSGTLSTVLVVHRTVLRDGEWVLFVFC